MTEPRSPNSSTPPVAPATPDADDRPTAVLPVASDRTGDQPTALQVKDKERGDVHQADDDSADSSTTADSEETRPTPRERQENRKRRTRANDADDSAKFGWRSQLIVMAIIYVAAIVLGVLLGLWLTNSMDTIPGVN